MNKAQRETYSAQVERRLKRFESQYLRQLYTALSTQVRTFTDDMKRRGVSAARGELYMNISNDQILPVISKLHVESGLYFARKAWREINDSVTKAGFGFNEQWTQSILDWFATDLFSTVSNITDSTREQILTVLTRGSNEGWSIEQIARELESPKMLLWRARLIARTELIKGSFIGRKVASDESEFETDKEWIAANDHRTRDSHRAVDGEVLSQQSRFQVARKKGGVDMMEGPGDPAASIENLANCRCSCSTVVRLDERGRPIRKYRANVIMPGNFNPNRTTITI